MIQSERGTLGGEKGTLRIPDKSRQARSLGLASGMFRFRLECIADRPGLFTLVARATGSNKDHLARGTKKEFLYGWSPIR
jgi:hypothetical protein